MHPSPKKFYVIFLRVNPECHRIKSTGYQKRFKFTSPIYITIEGGGNINKQRVYTFLSDEVITAIDEVAASKRVSRSELIRIAIEQYVTPEVSEDITLKDAEIKNLTLVKEDLTLNITKAKEDITLKDEEIYRLKDLLISKEQEKENLTLSNQNLTKDLTLIRETLILKEGEVTNLKQLLIAKGEEGDTLTLAVKERDQLRSEQDLRWRELQQIRSELNQTKRELEAAKSKENQLRSECDLAKSSENKISNELVALSRDIEHYKDTLNIKDKQIGFLEGHIAQLTQSISQLSLKPGEEEIKKKGWWQFWK